MCQCPERGDLHFHEKLNPKRKGISKCVNALKGATFISTNPKGTEERRNYGIVSMP